MKKNAIYVMLLMIGLTVFSWAAIYMNSESAKKEYSEGLAKAAKYEEHGIYIDSMEEYQTLMKKYPKDYSIIIKYADANYRLEKYKDFETACNKALLVEPENPEPFVLLIDYYMQSNKLQVAYDLSVTANKAIPTSEEILKRLDGFMGKYKEYYYAFDTISDWKNGYAAASTEGLWGIVDTKSESVIEYSFEAIGILSDENEEKLAVAPVLANGEWYYADKDGNRKLVSDKKYDYLGSFGNNYAPAKVGGKFGYINMYFEEFAFDYDEAGSFSNGVACVCKGGKWALIKTDFTAVTDFIYDEIKMDSYGYCSSFERIFAKTGNKYIMLDCNGNQVGSLQFDDVKVFASKQPAAVKIGDKWGFAAQDGTMICDAKYDSANSYASGLSGYLDGELWGVLNLKQETVIEPIFDEIKAFSNDGAFSYLRYGTLHINAMYAYDESEDVK